MAYNILGIHPGHNGSAALLSDGKLIYYLEEERLSRLKRDGNPFRTMIDICSQYKIDELIIGGTNDLREGHKSPWNDENYFSQLVRKYYPKVKVSIYNQSHHLLHSTQTFFNSGFEEASIIVIDGAGSLSYYDGKNSPSFECETIYKGSQNGIDLLYKSYFNSSNNYTLDGHHHLNLVTIGKTYEAVTEYLGWSGIEAGKTMGLAPYGKLNSNIPPLFKNGRGNSQILLPDYPGGAMINEDKNPIFQRNHKPEEWHTDPSKLTEIEADLAWQIQNDTQEEVAKLIEKSIELTGNKQICCSGGYFLNCVTNYYLTKRFPNIKFHFEPISHDGGTAIGAAYVGWVQHKQTILIPKQTTVYYGPQYTTKEYSKTLENYNDMFKQHRITPEQVAKLISERNIVTIFQGRSEAGPRALGNRSILYDPTDPNGKDFVNKVKNREWFRPFAGSVLKENAHEWFDMAGLEESPFMMYAMDVWPDKQEKIKAITHVDGTCRIQTVTEEQNPHYYKLIQEFKKITGVPILFNTSFNLAGDPLVETIEDALETMLKSEMRYMYVPELEMLLEKK